MKVKAALSLMRSVACRGFALIRSVLWCVPRTVHCAVSRDAALNVPHYGYATAPVLVHAVLDVLLFVKPYLVVNSLYLPVSSLILFICPLILVFSLFSCFRSFVISFPFVPFACYLSSPILLFPESSMSFSVRFSFLFTSL